MNARYIVDLTSNEEAQLKDILRGGTHRSRRVMRAQILLLANQGKSPGELKAALPTSSSTIYRCCRRFVEGGLRHALNDRHRQGGTQKLDAKDVATLVAIACSKAPEGRKRWTLKLLNERFIALTDHDSVSSETLRRRLQELDLKPWQKRMWCIADVTPEFIARMEHILQLYALPEDVDFPVVCFDETLKQLVEEVKPPLPMKPGQSVREDHHYRRNGSTSLAMFFCAHTNWREVRVLTERTYKAFAYLMRELVDVHFPHAKKVRVVMDNLNTHCAGALYKTFPPAEARRILDRLEFNFTPVHASWLNMVEIELGVLSRQCLDRRIGSREELAREVAAWVSQRNAEEATIKWLFDVEAARQKFRRHYPELEDDESPLLAA
jgi:transposase